MCTYIQASGFMKTKTVTGEGSSSSSVTLPTTALEDGTIGPKPPSSMTVGQAPGAGERNEYSN